jgi:hypothetical protein
VRGLEHVRHAAEESIGRHRTKEEEVKCGDRQQTMSERL